MQIWLFKGAIHLGFSQDIGSLLAKCDTGLAPLA
jgi:hypothetical protein